MTDYAFRIVNVFAEAPLAGNPLCVFEDGRSLTDATMQALALQFNLSETTFILPSDDATAHVRIFTPTFEMPFAGHPTLGTAHVVRAIRGGDRVTLRMIAGVIPVEAEGDVWTLSARASRHREPEASRGELASMLRIEADAILDRPLWVDTGTEQLVVPLASFEAVRSVDPDAPAMTRVASNGARAMAYAFAREGDHVLSRFFFLKHGAVIEDPGTGSACANLGGWLLATRASLPQRLRIDQGESVLRPCRLGLEVTTDARIRVSGRVIEIGRGVISL
jgi:trans-2,3-dihydro-3-hydroxyanthranilate isomerase